MSSNERFVRSGNREATVGSHLLHEIGTFPKYLIELFGEPDIPNDNKTSGEYIFYDNESGLYFTIYDYKQTMRYESNLPTVYEFWHGSKLQALHIGGTSRTIGSEFKRWLLSKLTTYHLRDEETEQEGRFDRFISILDEL